MKWQPVPWDWLSDCSSMWFINCEIVLYSINEPPNIMQRPCRGGYQPPASFRLLSGRLNGKNAWDLYEFAGTCLFFRVVLRGRLIASTTGDGWSSYRLFYILYLNQINAPFAAETDDS